MTARACSDPVGLDDLIAYERGELAADEAAAVEEHYFGCDYCTGRLELLHELRAGVIDSMRRGAVTGGATAAMIEQAIARGVGVRSYRLEPGEQVPCTCAPADDFVAVRLSAAVDADERVDMAVRTVFLDTGDVHTHSREDLVADRSTNEVIVLYAGDAIRAAPRSQWTMHLHAVGPRGARVLGPFTLDHTPWDERAGSE